MNLGTLRQLEEQGELDDNTIISECIFNGENTFAINNYLILPIITSTAFDKEQSPIEIKDSNNSTLGYIHLSTSEEIEEGRLTDWLKAAYLVDVEEEEFRTRIVKINRDYFVLDLTRKVDYETNYWETSPIWGNFFHANTLNTNLPKTNHPNPSTITAIDNLRFPTNWHKESYIHALKQPYVFERFLKKYHLLELLYDYQVMVDIQDLDLTQENDLINGGYTLKMYAKDDIKRLKYILEKCNDFDRIIVEFNKSIPFRDTMHKIFYKYGKESNPLKDINKFNDLLDITTFEWTDITKRDIASNVGIKYPNENKYNRLSLEEQTETDRKSINNYHKFILKLMTYWIYRVRSSIAHHKIGEYLMTKSDEEFVLKFAEPLIDEVIKQCLTIQT